jgi:hypothetical protein
MELASCFKLHLNTCGSKKLGGGLGDILVDSAISEISTKAKCIFDQEL